MRVERLDDEKSAIIVGMYLNQLPFFSPLSSYFSLSLSHTLSHSLFLPLSTYKHALVTLIWGKARAADFNFSPPPSPKKKVLA